ncbi:RING finger protein 32 [Megalops cyprinoides]|uniref:RING finger protein 32 n=1 Tax=Megalops cyprinoides TaxID=118141 RepID=UPI0018640739|nr:RING finger protein 32 [Megalops cyprinoides]
MQHASSRTSTAKMAITAAALQDHILRNLELQSLSLQTAAVTKQHRNPRRNRKPPSRTCGNSSASNSGTRLKNLHQHDGEQEEEYVLDPSPPPMTMAQRLGLVEALPMPLTGDEWNRVKLRSVNEGDSSQPCVICREEFRLQPQVLLSCSHVFHRVCLEAFEKFSGRKCCPMCRRRQYETRVIHDGARLYRQKCAIRIQACWRGYVVRKWYRDIRKTVPPKDKHLRRKFFEGKFQELNDSFVQSCNTNIEEFLQAIDSAVASSRNVFHDFEKHHISDLKEEDWQKIQEKAVQRDIQDCPICLAPLCASGTETRERKKEGRPVLLLSCSHLFHLCCLEAFERFCLEDQPVCPLCRSRYQKITI